MNSLDFEAVFTVQGQLALFKSLSLDPEHRRGMLLITTYRPGETIMIFLPNSKLLDAAADGAFMPPKILRVTGRIRPDSDDPTKPALWAERVVVTDDKDFNVEFFDAQEGL